MLKNRTLVGAIRWDAWMPGEKTAGEPEKRSVGQQVAETLSDPRYHWRVPFFARLAEDGVTVSYPVPTQAIFDREMQYAAQAGVDYFAYCMYEEDSGMTYARAFHTISPWRNTVKMAVILNAGKYDIRKHIQELLNAFQQTYYVKVCGERPLVFFCSFTEGQTGGDMDALRIACEEAGLQKPYFTAMFPHREEDKHQYFDAVTGGYSVDGYDGIPYQQLAKRAVERWEIAREKQQQLIPILTAGWDPRPRIERPVTWMQIPVNRWAQPLKAEELAAHLRRGLEFVKENKDCCSANALLFYAWNENDEGGFLVPTGKVDAYGQLLKDGEGNLIPETERLDAIRHVLQQEQE